MPTVECPATVVFCPPTAGGGGLAFDGSDQAPDFEGIVPAGQAVDTATFEVSTVDPNRVLTVQGQMGGAEENNTEEGWAGMLTLVFTVDQNGTFMLLDAGDSGDIGNLDIAFTNTADSLTIQANNGQAEQQWVMHSWTLTETQLPFPLPPPP